MDRWQRNLVHPAEPRSGQRACRCTTCTGFSRVRASVDGAVWFPPPLAGSCGPPEPAFAPDAESPSRPGRPEAASATAGIPKRTVEKACNGPGEPPRDAIVASAEPKAPKALAVAAGRRTVGTPDTAPGAFHPSGSPCVDSRRAAPRAAGLAASAAAHHTPWCTREPKPCPPRLDISGRSAIRPRRDRQTPSGGPQQQCEGHGHQQAEHQRQTVDQYLRHVPNQSVVYVVHVPVASSDCSSPEEPNSTQTENKNRTPMTGTKATDARDHRPERSRH